MKKWKIKTLKTVLVQYTVNKIALVITAYEGTANISEMEMFEMLDRPKLKPTASGLDTLPAWFLRLAAPIFAAPLADLLSMSLATSYTPHQWKTAVIKPIPKNSCPASPSDYRPILITAILSHHGTHSRQRIYLPSSPESAEATWLYWSVRLSTSWLHYCCSYCPPSNYNLYVNCDAARFSSDWLRGQGKMSRNLTSIRLLELQLAC